LSAQGLREELEAMLDAETATLAESSYIKTKSGQRAKVESIDEMIYPTEYDPPEIPQTVTLTEAQAPGTAANPTAFDVRNVGTTLEVDPNISADAKTIDLNIAPEIIRFLGREYTLEDREDLDLYDPKILSSTIYQPKFHAMKHSTAVTVRDGDTILLCIHRPDDAPDKTMMVFLRADVVR
jgi:general secretion pathway protein D